MSPDHRRTAAAWHGGQGSPLYAYASTGDLVGGVDDEILDCLAIVERGELDVEFDAVDEHERLLALLRHIEPELAKGRAGDLGREHGESAAACWDQDVFGGRATGDTTAVAQRVLRGIEDGDPLVLDALPGWNSVASADEILAEIDWSEPSLDDRVAHHRWQGARAAVLDAYASAFAEAFLEYAAQACRAELALLTAGPSSEPLEQDLPDPGSPARHERPASARSLAVQLSRDGAGPHDRSDATPVGPVESGNTTLPFLRVIDRPDFGRSPEAGHPTPPGWVAEAIGSWAGREVEVVYDARRYEIMLTASEPTADVAAAFEAEGWERRGSTGQRSFWVRDRVAATRTALARLDAATAEMDRARSADAIEQPFRRGPGHELAL